MNKKFLRDDFEYYLEIEAENGEDYEYQMLLVNQIDTILPVNIITVNEKRQLIYSASGYKTLESCLEKMVINGEQILRVVECILDGIDEVRRYLLAPNNLVLTPDCLFVEPDYSRAGLIYVPGYSRDIILQLRDLMEIFLGRIDSSDMQSIMLAWKLHTLMKEEHISLKEIRKTMSGYKAGEGSLFSVQKEEEDMQRRSEHREIKGTFLRKKREFILQWFTKRTIIFKASLLITTVLLLIFISSIAVIYIGGILPWKRNLMLITGILFAISAAVTAAFWKKDEIIRTLRELKEK